MSESSSFKLKNLLADFNITDDVYKGIVGQLAGHGVAYGKMIASGQTINLTSTDLMWIAFSLGSEAVIMYEQVKKIPYHEIAVPLALQVGVPYMYQDGFKNKVTRISEGEVMVLLDNPSLMGTIGSVLAKNLL